MASAAGCLPGYRCKGEICCAEAGRETAIDGVKVFQTNDEVHVDARGSPASGGDDVGQSLVQVTSVWRADNSLTEPNIFGDTVEGTGVGQKYREVQISGHDEIEKESSGVIDDDKPVDSSLVAPKAPPMPFADDVKLRDSSDSVGLGDPERKMSRAISKHTDTPMTKESLLGLSGFFTGKASPDFQQVEAWCWTVSGGDRRPLFGTRYFFLVTVVLILNWGVSAVLAFAGLLFAWLYRDAFDWETSFQPCLIFGILGGIFTGWNIAQYASFAIQTTGHLTFRQHLRAVAWVAPVLLPCNFLGWIMGVIVLATPLSDASVPVIVLLVAGPPIAAGIASKTLWKLRYLAAHARATNSSASEDSLGKRLRAEAFLAGGNMACCPFQKVGAKLWGVHFAAPFTCFLWTVAYVIGLRKGYVWAGELEEIPRNIVQVVLFATSLSATALGMKLLTNWVKGSSGYFGYNHQMLVAFIVIYGLVSDVQVRLGIVKMHGWTRLICTTVQPAYASILRALMSRSWYSSMTRKSSLDNIMEVDNQEPRLVIMVMGIVIAQNVSSILLSGTTCIFEEVPGFSLGECEAGFGLQILRDAAATWLFDVLSVYFWVQKGMPVLYFFSMLDPFLTIAAILVVYVCTILALLTACIQ